jgi:glucose/arabinose dehydrogenase
MRKLIGIALAVLPFLLAAPVSAQKLALRPVAANLPGITSVVNARDSRLFITLQHGQVMIWDRTQVLPTPFLDVSSLVSCCGEQGLDSIVFHPRYRENGIFFIDYSDHDGNTVVARYHVSSDRNVADPTSATVLMRIPHPFENHYSGEMQFGPDGYLYIGLGDGGSAGDPFNNAQNLGVLLGKIMRIDVDSASPYAIPPTNPFVNNAAARPEIWAFGLRNPWRFTFDRENGDLWIADVGQAAWEEVDLQRRTSIGGENYGWRRMEATHCYNPATACDTDDAITMPILEYSHVQNRCSITGGYRYRGSLYPALRGKYLYADYCTGELWAVTEGTAGQWTSTLMLATQLQPTTFGEDENGELFIGGSNGVYALVDETPRAPRRRAVGP